MTGVILCYPMSYQNEGDGVLYYANAPIGHGIADSAGYARVNLGASASGAVALRYVLDAVALPDIAAVTAVECRAKVRYSGDSSSAQLRVCFGAAEEVCEIGSATQVYSFSPGVDADLSSCSVLLYIEKAEDSGKALSAYFHAAELAVSYEIPLEDPEVEVTAQYRGVRLSWGAVENAQRYRVLRDGVQVFETGGLEYTDTAANDAAEHVYTVCSVYEGFVSDGTEVTVTVPLCGLVFDRVAADVVAKNARGTYNASDLNRVAEAVGYVGGMLDAYGYAVLPAPASDWEEGDIPRFSEMRGHIEAVRSIDVIRYADEKIELPGSMEKLDYVGANNMEKFLLLAGAAAERIPDAWLFCGELYGGEI